MSRLPQRLLEDRALRDAARDVLIADVEHARRSLSRKGVTKRVADRISGGAKEVFESAIEHTQDHRGILAALIALIIAWFAREPLLELFGLREDDSDETDDAAQSDVTAEADGDDTDTPAPSGEPAEPAHTERESHD